MYYDSKLNSQFIVTAHIQFLDNFLISYSIFVHIQYMYDTGSYIATHGGVQTYRV